MFVVCGEALMDVFAAGDTRRRRGARCAHRRLAVQRGDRPGAAGAAGGLLSARCRSGFLGERLLRALDAEGVDTARVQRIDAPTTLGLVGLDAQRRARLRLLRRRLRRPPAAARCAGARAAAARAPSTSAPTRWSSSRSRRRCARWSSANTGAALIAYDPNVRLNVEPDLARWRDMLRLDAAAHPPAEDQRGRPAACCCPARAARRRWPRAGSPRAWRWWWSRAAREGAAAWTPRAMRGVPTGAGRGRRHRRRRRHVPGRPADLAGRARRAVGRRRCARCRRPCCARCWASPRVPRPSPVRAAAPTCRGVGNSTEVDYPHALRAFPATRLRRQPGKAGSAGGTSLICAQAAMADADARHLLHLPRPGRRGSGLPSPVLKLAWQRRHTYILELDIIGFAPGPVDGRAAVYSACVCRRR